MFHLRFWEPGAQEFEKYIMVEKSSSSSCTFHSIPLLPHQMEVGFPSMGKARNSLSPQEEVGGAVVCHWQGLESFGF